MDRKRFSDKRKREFPAYEVLQSMQCLFDKSCRYVPPFTAFMGRRLVPVILRIIATLFFATWLLVPAISQGKQASSGINTYIFLAAAAELPSCVQSRISSQDALLVAGPGGRIIYSRNETKKYVPASTLKILTGLAAIHHLGTSYRFHTEFYVDCEQNLKVKGYGDPLLVSEVWQEIARTLAPKLQGFNDLVLDDTYFLNDIIPGVGSSTNPYDAPNGALCANFNTVFFKRDNNGRIVSAEPQTPMTPFALEKIRARGLDVGRHAFSHRGHEAARYAAELLVHFLREHGKACQGKVRAGVVKPGDALIYAYHSIFTLEQALKKMLEFSNNFMANQILLALGAHVHGPPGTLAKGVRVVSDYCREVLHLDDVEIIEGSGISRKNRLSALDMLAALKRFEPHRSLLVREGRLLYKTGSLCGIKTRAGYIESNSGSPYYFVIFLKGTHANIDSILECVKKNLNHAQDASD
jgi:D-alanyl-D-alanine carboxypeptidase/D-alanyl-D-alanine-endopeptidase (penicillin-binding protein 4)